MNYRIDWDDYTSTWWANSTKFRDIHARHENKQQCVNLLASRVQKHEMYFWMINSITPGGYKVAKYNVDQIIVQMGSKTVYTMLVSCDFDAQPRAQMIALLRAVDDKIQHRDAYDFTWYRVWVDLIQYLDPLCLLKFPDPDWSLIDGTEATEIKREDLGL